MNQRLLRPEAFCFNRFASIERSSHYAEGTKNLKNTHPKPPSHQKHNRYGSKKKKLMLTAYKTISYGNEYFRCFTVSLSAGEERSVRCVSWYSGVTFTRRWTALPPYCVQFKSIACLLRVKFYFWGSRHPQCSVKILSCTFAFSTHVWFSTSFFPCT